MLHNDGLNYAEPALLTSYTKLKTEGVVINLSGNFLRRSIMVHKQTKGLTHDVVLMLSDGLSQ
jgi:hypothetical protein